jgi:hypothetical protein
MIPLIPRGFHRISYRGRCARYLSSSEVNDKNTQIIQSDMYIAFFKMTMPQVQCFKMPQC